MGARRGGSAGRVVPRMVHQGDSASAERDDLLIVGAVQKPHGIRGELLIRVETDRPAEVFRPDRRLRLGDPQGEPTGETVTVERARPFKDGVLVKVQEFATRDETLEALRGRTLLLPRDEVPPLEEGEVFIHQLPGLEVVAAGEAVGRVREVFDAPSGHLLEVRTPDGRDLLIPFVRDIVVRVDAAGGVLELNAPAGLLDL